MWSLTAGSLGGSGKGWVTKRSWTKFLCGVRYPTDASTWLVQALTAATVASASMAPLAVITPRARPSRMSNPKTGSFSLISTPMSSTFALRAGTYLCGSEYPRSQVEHAGVGLVRHEVGESLADLLAAQHLELASKPPPHVPEGRRFV